MPRLFVSYEVVGDSLGWDSKRIASGTSFPWVEQFEMVYVDAMLKLLEKASVDEAVAIQKTRGIAISKAWLKVLSMVRLEGA